MVKDGYFTDAIKFLQWLSNFKEDTGFEFFTSISSCEKSGVSTVNLYKSWQDYVVIEFYGKHGFGYLHNGKYDDNVQSMDNLINLVKFYLTGDS